MEFLKKCLSTPDSGENSDAVLPHAIIGDNAKVVVHVASDPLLLKQGSYGQESAFSLAMCKLPHSAEVQINFIYIGGGGYVQRSIVNFVIDF